MTNKQDDPWLPAASAIFEPFSKLENMTLHGTRYVSWIALTSETCAVVRHSEQEGVEFNDQQRLAATESKL